MENRLQRENAALGQVVFKSELVKSIFFSFFLLTSSFQIFHLRYPESVYQYTV